MDVVTGILAAKYPEDLVQEVVRGFVEVKRNLLLRRFKPGELEGGFFVESVRRILEIELYDTAISVNRQLLRFDDSAMKRYENGVGDDAFRLHIPRVLRSIYDLRNKRGVGHFTGVTPNAIDCTLVASACDWVLAEMVRQVSTLPVEACQYLIEKLVRRRIPLVFEDRDVKRVLEPGMQIRDQVLVLMLSSTGSVQDADLRSWTEYSNVTRFREREASRPALGASQRACDEAGGGIFGDTARHLCCPGDYRALNDISVPEETTWSLTSWSDPWRRMGGGLSSPS